MPDNITVKDANKDPQVVKTRLRGGIHTQVVEQEKVTAYMNLDLDENGVSVIGTAAILHNAEVFNDHADPIYVKAYNKATAPTNADVPVRVWEIMPAAEPFRFDVANGIDFPLGLGLRCTPGRANNDNTALPANVCLINLGYRAG